MLGRPWMGAVRSCKGLGSPGRVERRMQCKSSMKEEKKHPVRQEVILKNKFLGISQAKKDISLPQRTGAGPRRQTTRFSCIQDSLNHFNSKLFPRLTSHLMKSQLEFQSHLTSADQTITRHQENRAQRGELISQDHTAT
jgi:hypothetical protein